MSDLDNPYQSPESPIVPETSQSSGISLSETMLRYLNEASPWLRFVGVLGFVGCGIAVLSGIIFAIMGTVALSALGSDLDDFPAWIFAVIYIPIGVLLFFPSYFIYNFGKRIRNFQFSNSTEDLELAFKNNKSLWKFNGIMYIIYLASIPVFIIIAIVGGVVAALSGM
jgi:hypothetical protein